jgi:phosphotransferase system HPr (HPr) family protein
VAQASSDTARSAAAAAEVTLPADVDLHARPAADFVRTAMRFECDVRVAVGERETDAKSLLSVLALGARRGTPLRLSADGPDAADAVRTLAATVAAFSE